MRKQGSFIGGLVGDALGTTLEFMSADAIARKFPHGHREIVGGGPFNVLPGQITDDSELTLACARTLLRDGWSLDARAHAYQEWFASEPFDIGNTTRLAFSEKRTAAELMAHVRLSTSQANGALMRVGPIALFGAALSPEDLAERAREDARLSHPACQEENAAFVRAVQVLLHAGSPHDAYDQVRPFCPDVSTAPVCDGRDQGWVRIALHNAFHCLLYAQSFEQALVETVMRGGDTDTNATIAGTLLGAHYGLVGIPDRWVRAVLCCKTNRGATYQTHDAMQLADSL